MSMSSKGESEKASAPEESISDSLRSVKISGPSGKFVSQKMAASDGKSVRMPPGSVKMTAGSCKSAKQVSIDFFVSPIIIAPQLSC